MNKLTKPGNNDISQKIMKYLSSPKEASKSAEAAFLGASAMFEGLFLGILGCCQIVYFHPKSSCYQRYQKPQKERLTSRPGEPLYAQNP